MTSSLQNTEYSDGRVSFWVHGLSSMDNHLNLVHVTDFENVARMFARVVVSFNFHSMVRPPSLSLATLCANVYQRQLSRVITVCFTTGGGV